MEQIDNIIQEIRFKEILQKAKDKNAPVAKTFKIQARLDEINLESFMIKFSTQDFGIQGSRRTHETYLQINKRFSPKLWNTSKDLVKLANNINALKAFLTSYLLYQHTNYYCSCESFKYGGFHYMANKNRSTLTDDKGIELPSQKETRPPKKTNPNMRGLTCKHLIGIIQTISEKFYNKIITLLQNELKKVARAKKKGMKYKMKKVLKPEESEWITIEGTYNDFDISAWEDEIRNLGKKHKSHKHIVTI